MSWSISAAGDKDALFRAVDRSFEHHESLVERDSSNPDHASKPMAYKNDDGKEYVRSGILPDEYRTAKSIVFALLGSVRAVPTYGDGYLIEASGHGEGFSASVQAVVKPVFIALKDVREGQP